MRKIILIALLILIFSATQIPKICFSQSGWYQLQPGVNADFYSLYFTSPSIGYVVGNQYILKTTDAGFSWNIRVNNSNFRFRSVVFINQNTGIAAGRDGLIMKTTDAGNNWIYKNSGNINDLTELFMYDNNNGFISGGFETFLRTTNCGESWSGYTISEPYHLYSVYFSSENTGWSVGGGGRIFKSSNFGLNWALQNSPTNIELHEVFFRDQSTGMAIGLNGIYLKTSNAGLNWNIQNLGTNKNVYRIFFINTNNGWIVGDTVILHTTNFGSSWDEQQSNHPAVYVQSFFVNEITGYIAGFGSTILKTTNGGNPIGIKHISSEIPSQFSLHQNYPNPFNPTTKIQYAITNKSNVELKIFDATGHLVAQLVNEQQTPGTYEAEFDGSAYASGIYFYQLIVNGATEFTETRRMVIIK